MPGRRVFFDVSFTNNAQIPLSSIDFRPDEGSKIGSVSVSGSGSLGDLWVSVSTPYSETEKYVFTEEERQQIAADLTNSLSLYANQVGMNGGPRKNLNLRVRTDETEGLTIRFDEEVLDILERAKIDTVTLLTYTDKEAFMQYIVADLRAAREKYGLALEELLIVGGMDDEVMKGTVDGSIVPVE